MGERIMGMREKDQADFDLETFVDLFDTAMSSDNPAVQRALKNLVLISAMVNAQQDPNGLRKGPLRRVIEDIQALNKRIGQLESAGAYRSTYAPTTGSPGTTSIPSVYPQPYYGPTPGTTATPGQTQWPTVLPGTFPPGTVISGQSVGGGSIGVYGAPGPNVTSISASNSTQAKSYVDSLGAKVDSLLDKLEAK